MPPHYFIPRPGMPFVSNPPPPGAANYMPLHGPPPPAHMGYFAPPPQPRYSNGHSYVCSAQFISQEHTVYGVNFDG